MYALRSTLTAVAHGPRAKEENKNSAYCRTTHACGHFRQTETVECPVQASHGRACVPEDIVLYCICQKIVS